MRLLLFILLLGASFSGWGQQKLVIVGHITDADTILDVKDSKVYIQGEKDRFVLTNRQGNFTFILNHNADKNYTLVIEDVRYETYYLEIKKKDLKKKLKDTLHVIVQLKFREISGATVFAVQEVYGSERVSVSDFEFVGEENYVMLVYEKRLNKGSTVIYTDKEQKTLSSWEILEPAKEFYKDFLGNLYLICEKNVYEITVTDDILHLQKTDNKFFDDYVKPWIDTVKYKAYHSNFVSFYPSFDYFSYSTIDSSDTKLKNIINKNLMELYRAQYKYMDGHEKLEAYRMELATGIDKEIWGAIWTGFPNDLYYKELYAPMFIKNDTVLVFDHYSNKMYKYDRNNHLIDSLEITYHLESDKREWEELIIQDRNKQRIFSVFLRGGKIYLKELNTSTGEIRKVHQLYYKYPEKLKVKNNYAYYIYRPFESLQNKYLYREELPIPK